MFSLDFFKYVNLNFLDFFMSENTALRVQIRKFIQSQRINESPSSNELLLPTLIVIRNLIDSLEIPTSIGTLIQISCDYTITV